MKKLREKLAGMRAGRAPHGQRYRSIQPGTRKRRRNTKGAIIGPHHRENPVSGQKRTIPVQGTRTAMSCALARGHGVQMCPVITAFESRSSIQMQERAAASAPDSVAFPLAQKEGERLLNQRRRSSPTVFATSAAALRNPIAAACGDCAIASKFGKLVRAGDRRHWSPRPSHPAKW